MLKPLISVLLLLFITISSFSQDKYSKTKVWLNDMSLHELQELGVCIDHGVHKQNVFYITDLSEDEIQTAKQAGFTCEIIIDDVSAYYKKRNENALQKGTNASDCDGVSYPDVTHFSLGSMGGFFTYQEMLDNLDAMYAQYPHIVSQKAPISTFLTHENRPIYWVRISNNPTVDENKKEILYTAIHHAREPVSMSQLIYYMWYLLENYDKSNDIKTIVDNLELYFVPCINPDGYIHNETTDPSGGGMHRKNKRNTGGSNPGVDLNRNYSYQWGGVGSSGNPGNDTYRGPSPFSEPETQAIKWLTEQHEFEIALNYHAYADELLHPWGYTTALQCSDHDLYLDFKNYLTEENGYLNRQSSELYEAAGDSDDWMYGDVSTKPKILAMTPEVGGNSDGFWPAQTRIVPLCKENLHQNLGSARILLDFAKINDLNPTLLSSETGYFKYSLQRLGLDPTPYTVSLNIIPSGFTGPDNSHPPLTYNEVIVDSILYNLSGASTNEFKFVLTVNTGNYTYVDTFTKYYGNSEIVFVDEETNLVPWESSTSWDKTSLTYYNAPFSTTDSPSGDYGNNQNNTLTLETPINLTHATQAFLNFWAKWDIEAGWDYAQVLASINGSNAWTPLCGNFTKNLEMRIKMKIILFMMRHK